MSKGFFLVFILVFSVLFVPVVCWTDDNTGLWQITNIHSFNPIDISQSCSLKKYLEGETAGSITHSLALTSCGEGESMIHNVLSVTPVGDFWSGTSIGYNSSGGTLSGKEVGGAIICGYKYGCEESGSDVAVGAGYEIVELKQGAIHSDIIVNPVLPPVGSYDFLASSDDGYVKSGVAMTSYSDSSEQNYEQHITVEGEFYIYHSAEVN